MKFCIPKISVYRFIAYIFIFTGVTTLISCDNTTQLQPLPSGATILAFGDSLTYGTGTSRDKAYPAILEKRTKIKVINAGIPGEITTNGLARLPSLLDKYQPDLIIICHGGNDMLRKLSISQASNNIQKMIELARASNTQVILIGVPEFGIFLDPSPIYQKLADKNELPIANDILSEILSKNAFKSDQIHPNSEGYQLFAQRIESILRQSGALL